MHKHFKKFTYLLLLIPILAMTGCMSTPNSGEIGVVRNGGPFDNKNIRQIVPNGAGNTWVGWMSSTHYYPVDTQQRFFKFEACYGEKGCSADAPPIAVQTKDGVDVSIEGTFYLNTTFNDSSRGQQVLKEFDTQFATRTFGNGEHAYDGNSGWSNFLGTIVEPIVKNNLRSTVSGLECAELVSSCALVQNGSANVNVTKIARQKNNQSNIQTVQQTVQQGLGTDLVDTLGGKKKTSYFQNITFNLTRVDLPGKVQAAINDAQAQYAEVSKVNARVAQAQADRNVQHQKYLANKEREKGYSACPSCAKQDELSKLPSGLNTLVFGSGSPVAIGK